MQIQIESQAMWAPPPPALLKGGGRKPYPPSCLSSWMPPHQPSRSPVKEPSGPKKHYHFLLISTDGNDHFLRGTRCSTSLQPCKRSCRVLAALPMAAGLCGHTFPTALVTDPLAKASFLVMFNFLILFSPFLEVPAFLFAPPLHHHPPLQLPCIFLPNRM